MPILTFSPAYAPTESTQKPEFKLLEAEFGDGYSQSAPDGMNHIRQVATLSWDVLNVAQADYIENWIVTHKGTDPFLWRLSDDPVVRKWTCKDYSRKRGTPNSITATFRQSFVIV